jgi:oligosaccharide repeat unit polymerase
LGTIIANKKSSKKSIFCFYKINNSEVKCFEILSFVTFVAYFIWYLYALLEFDFTSIINNLAMSGFTSLWSTNRGHIPGVTTFTEFGPIVVSIGVSLYCKTSNEQLKKSIKKKITTIFLLSLVRFFVFSERLATIELAVPFIVTLFFYKKTSFIKNLLIPIFLLLFLFFGFSIGEYFRSWTYYSNVYQDGFLTFSFYRLIGYYATSLNNGCNISSAVTPLYAPYNSFSFLEKFPIIGAYYKNETLDNLYESIFISLCNPEFNNMSGFLTFYLDFGWLSIPIAFSFGLITGFVYKKAKAFDTFYLAFYSFIFYCLLEMPRLNVLNGTRGFFFFVALLIFFLFRGNHTRLIFDKKLIRTRLFLIKG